MKRPKTNGTLGRKPERFERRATKRKRVAVSHTSFIGKRGFLIAYWPPKEALVVRKICSMLFGSRGGETRPRRVLRFGQKQRGRIANCYCFYQRTFEFKVTGTSGFEIDITYIRESKVNYLGRGRYTLQFVQGEKLNRWWVYKHGFTRFSLPFPLKTPH